MRDRIPGPLDNEKSQCAILARSMDEQGIPTPLFISGTAAISGVLDRPFPVSRSLEIVDRVGRKHRVRVLKPI
jgi:hypothetical protein